MANQFTKSLTSLNLSASEISGMTGWPKMMTNDYLTNFANFAEIAMKSDELVEVVEESEANILINAENIAVNVTNISANAYNITINAANLASHEALASAHGVTGDNVGNLDFAQSGVGGVVLLAALVADLATIATADLLAAPATYNQAYTQLSANLTNENKAKINEIVLKVNEIIAGQITAKQMAAI